MTGILADVWTLFCTQLFPLSSEPGLFNPYRDSIPGVDLADGAGIRQQNLRNCLDAFSSRPSVVLVGEAPGWRGCRFSGVPFTSEAQLVEGNLPFSGRPTSSSHSPLKEATATIFWRHLESYHPQFFAWNCLPLHPHLPGDPLSNRTPTRTEIMTHAGFLASLLKLLRPRSVVAVGRNAQRTLAQIDVTAVYVRHPSHGGAEEFGSAVVNILDQTRQMPV